jgi:hypothetical protein
LKKTTQRDDKIREQTFSKGKRKKYEMEGVRGKTEKNVRNIISMERTSKEIIKNRNRQSVVRKEDDRQE